MPSNAPLQALQLYAQNNAGKKRQAINSVGSPAPSESPSCGRFDRILAYEKASSADYNPQLDGRKAICK
jgi:hypothetical protein